MDYSKYRFRAVVDWIDILIQTTATTNFQTVQRTFGAALHLPKNVTLWVEAQNEKPGGSASAFSVRVHDVERYSDIDDLLRKVGFDLSLKPGFEIREIEIALDAYNANPEQAARFYKFATFMADDKNHRLYRERRADRVQATPCNFKSLVKSIALGWQIGIGNKNDNIYQHVYYKTTDNSGQPIDESKHRARIEIKFSGAALPCQTREQWQDFNFTSLSRFFRFHELRDDLTPLEQVIADASPQIGARHKRNRREGGICLHSKFTKADKALNKRAYDALRELSRRWKDQPKRMEKRSPSAKLSTGKIELACGNVGEVEASNPHESSKENANSNNYTYDSTQCITTDPQDSTIGLVSSPNALHASRLDNDNHDHDHPVVGSPVRDAHGSPVTTDSGKEIDNDSEVRSTDVETLFPEMFNLSPDIQTEMARIDKLFDGGGYPPSRHRSHRRISKN